MEGSVKKYMLDDWAMNSDVIIQFFEQLGWLKVDDKEILETDVQDRIVMIQRGFSTRRAVHDAPSYLKNWLNNYCHHGITNKDELTFTIQKYYPEIYTKYFAQSTYITRDLEITGPGVVKDVRGFGGDGVFFVKDNKEFLDVVSELDLGKKHIYCEYLPNLLLFQNKKFHIRINLCVSVIENEPSFFLFRKGQIITAKEEFVLDDFQNSDIHDSHFDATTDNFLFPDDLHFESHHQTDSIYEQLREVFTTVVGLFTPKCRDDDLNSFEIFGADIFLTEDLDVKLLEINTRTGIGIKRSNRYNTEVNDERGKEYADDYWQSLIDCVINPLLGEEVVHDRVMKLNPTKRKLRTDDIFTPRKQQRTSIASITPLRNGTSQMNSAGIAPIHLTDDDIKRAERRKRFFQD